MSYGLNVEMHKQVREKYFYSKAIIVKLIYMIFPHFFDRHAPLFFFKPFPLI